jgi:putative oxidoreductase
MATTTYQTSRIRSEMISTKLSLWMVPFGRLLFSLIFILSSYGHFTGDLIPIAEGKGVPFAGIMVPFSGLIALIGGLSVLTGYKTRLGAILLMIFLVPVTFMIHNFWAISDPQEAQMQMIHFMKNLAMLGGVFLIYYFGPGPVSVDKK